MKHCIQLILCALLLGTSALHAQIPQMIAYQGRVAAGGVNFHGTGQFKFAIVRGNYGGAPGEPLNLWSNDGSLLSVDNTNAPTAAVSMTCDRGLYSVLLGNTAAGMVAVPPSVFANPDVRLRVWFNDGTHGWQKLTPDQRLVSVGYAMMADSATTAQTVADGAITTAKLANGSITSAKMGIGSVTSSSLANGSVTVGALADGHISTIKLADGSVTNAKLAAGAVNGASILDATITSADIFDGTIGTVDLANGAVTAAKIAGNTITAQEIAPAAVATSELADASVTTAKLTAGAVGTQQIQTGAVRGVEILDNSITSSDIFDGTIGTADLSNGAITAAKLATDTITSQEIAAGAITTSEIATATIQNIDLALNVINTGEIIDGAVQTADLATGSVTAAKLGNNAVTAPALRIPAVGVRAPAIWTDVPAPGLIIPFTDEDFDTQSLHSTATNTTRLSAPVTGIYQISARANFFFPPLSGEDWNRIEVIKNGTTTLARSTGLDGYGFEAFNDPLAPAGIALAALLSAGDYIEVKASRICRNSSSYTAEGTVIWGATASLIFVSQP